MDIILRVLEVISWLYIGLFGVTIPIIAIVEKRMSIDIILFVCVRMVLPVAYLSVYYLGE